MIAPIDDTGTQIFDWPLDVGPSEIVRQPLDKFDIYYLNYNSGEVVDNPEYVQMLRDLADQAQGDFNKSGSSGYIDYFLVQYADQVYWITFRDEISADLAAKVEGTPHYDMLFQPVNSMFE